MNLAFVGYEELSTILDLLNSSYPKKAKLINC